MLVMVLALVFVLVLVYGNNLAVIIMEVMRFQFVRSDSKTSQDDQSADLLFV